MKEIICPPCGERITGVDDDDLVEKVQTHAHETHDLNFSRPDILLQAEECAERRVLKWLGGALEAINSQVKRSGVIVTARGRGRPDDHSWLGFCSAYQ